MMASSARTSSMSATLLVAAAGVLWLRAFAVAETISSPCPEVFQYERGGGGSLQGRVLVPVNGPSIRLQIQLFVKAQILDKNAGKIIVAENNDAITRKLTTQRKELIQYTVIFPVSNPIPLVGYITVNENVICMGPIETSSPLTSLTLGHTLSLPDILHNPGTTNTLPRNELLRLQSGSGVPESPCPEVFQYERGDHGEWRGKVGVTLPADGPPIRLEVQLLLKALLFGDNKGTIIVAENNDVLVRKFKTRSKEQIKYTVVFPISDPIPHVSLISVNEKLICRDSKVSNNVLTNLTLRHTLSDPENLHNSGATSTTPQKGLSLQTTPQKGQSEPGVPVSPCPEVFQYERGDGGEWQARVWVKPPPQGLPLRLQVQLSVNASVPKDDPGGILVGETDNVLARKIVPGSRESIQYIVVFPLHYPLPHVDRISVNEKQICSGPGVTNSVFTKISLEHTLLGSATTHNSGTMNTERSTISPTSQSVSDICGQALSATRLVVNGQKTNQGDWPWLVAIFLQRYPNDEESEPEFQCGGTLINRRYVVSAAHCFSMEDSLLINPDNLDVYLGMFNIKRRKSLHVQQKKVDRVHVHPDYKVGVQSDADIAVLRIKSPADYTLHVRPICSWKRNADLQDVVGLKGTLIGWGRNEKRPGPTDVPHLTDLPIVSQQQCRRSDSRFEYFTSNRTFCAGFRDDSGPCLGDSGSGLILKLNDKEETRWYLRGVTSTSLRNDNRNIVCDLTHYVVFTDVAQYGSWLKTFAKEE